MYMITNLHGYLMFVGQLVMYSSLNMTAKPKLLFQHLLRTIQKY